MMREGQHADHNTPPKHLSTVATSLDKLSPMSPAFILQSRSTKFKLKSHEYASHAEQARVAATVVQPADPNPPLCTRRITKVIVQPQTNSNDFVFFWNYLPDSNSIFVVADFFFFERFDFLRVQSSITCNEICHVHVLWRVCTHPHNSISNVVVSVTIHDNIYMYKYIYIYMYMDVCERIRI